MWCSGPAASKGFEAGTPFYAPAQMSNAEPKEDRKEGGKGRRERGEKGERERRRGGHKGLKKRGKDVERKKGRERMKEGR